jgi:hypothetical protein
MIRALCAGVAAMALLTSSGLATAAPSEADAGQPQGAGPPKDARITNTRVNANGITTGGPTPGSAPAGTAPNGHKASHSDFTIQKHLDASSPSLSTARRPGDHHPGSTLQPGGAAQSAPRASPPP